MYCAEIIIGSEIYRQELDLHKNKIIQINIVRNNLVIKQFDLIITPEEHGNFYSECYTLAYKTGIDS